MRAWSFLKVSERALVFAGGAVTVIAVALLSLHFWTLAEGWAADAQITEEVQALNVEVDRLHYRRMSVVADFTNDVTPDVARLYREIDEDLSLALARMSANAVTLEEKAAAEAASYAYQTMAGFESDALALALAGRAERAHDDLYSDAYTAARLQFGEAMSNAREAVWSRLAPSRNGILGTISSFAVLAPIAAFLGVAVCLLLYARIRAFSERLRQTQVKLESATSEIARRERETHANLIARSPTPTVEFKFPPAVKLVAWLRSRGIDDLDRWLKIYPGEIRKLAPHFKVGQANDAAMALLKADARVQVCELDRWMPDRALHACALAILRALWAGETQVTLELAVRAFDGESRMLEVRGHLARKSRSSPPTFVATLSDISEVSRLKDTIAQAREDVEEAERARDAFITSLSRDLRAQLDGVTGMARALARTKLDRDQRELLAVVSDAGEVMRDTLDRAHDYTKLEAGDLDVEAEEFDVDALARAADARFSNQARAKNLRLRVGVEDSARVRVTGDEVRSRQILSKLVGNAVKHTPNGEVEARIALEPQKDGGMLLAMTVRDTGAGMSEAELALALDDRSGSGAGLAFCRRLCLALGGNLEIKSSADYGTSVVARVRVSPAAAASDETDAATGTSGDGDQDDASARQLKILAADDNAINRAVLRDMLEPLGYDMTLVENGADAIAAWRAQAFDIILMDIHMPVLSGCDVAREIRRIEAEDSRERTPIIAVSASVMKSEVDECYESGMDGHVPKPLELARLRKAIETAVEAPRPDTVGDAARGGGEADVA